MNQKKNKTMCELDVLHKSLEEEREREIERERDREIEI